MKNRKGFTYKNLKLGISPKDIARRLFLRRIDPIEAKEQSDKAMLLGRMETLNAMSEEELEQRGLIGLKRLMEERIAGMG